MAVIYKMKLAEQVIRVSALFPSTKIFCHKYLTDQRVDFEKDVERILMQLRSIGALEEQK